MASVPFELKGNSFYAAGNRGMVGNVIVRQLAREEVKLVTWTRARSISASRPKGVGEGTGLGLSQVSDIAGQAGGIVRIDSRVGESTTVYILLRKTEACIEQDRGARSSGEPKSRQDTYRRW
ncbi:hypothetical protein [Bradyrhizobium sp. BR13661]|jgi:hypothetical protein|uniref:hypothetical protein n=1 Tax=Bradyrhizobium sp. BR13661 TaxID=2940622 RepID=UPI002476E405|nr:hypothetical protein [Bradyrhizobium sp. BR13661]MDH6263580.1 hypothetical protein [Bradyrhizobium sp. BR13661]